MRIATLVVPPRIIEAISLVALVGVLALNVTPAQARLLTWTLQDAVFDDGTASTGSFTIDFVTDSIIDFDIIVSQGAGPFTAFEYTPTTATVRGDRRGFSLRTDQPFDTDPSALRHFDLGFGSFVPGNPGCACTIPLPETGGTVPIFVMAGSREQFGDAFGSGIRWLDGGTVVAPVQSIPEPHTVLFFLAGIALFGAMRGLRSL
jgi:hypothetical protein